MTKSQHSLRDFGGLDTSQVQWPRLVSRVLSHDETKSRVLSRDEIIRLSGKDCSGEEENKKNKKQKTVGEVINKTCHRSPPKVAIEKLARDSWAEV